jgi:protein CpxP
MNTPHNTDTRAKRRWTISAALALAACAAAFASAGPALHGHQGQHAMTPEALKAHIGKMIEQCASDADSDRKARLAAIADAAVDDLRPTHEQFRRDHERVHALMMAPVVDRAALEQWRAAQIRQIDIMSRRVVTAAADAADLLSPEQRASCAGRLGMPMH